MLSIMPYCHDTDSGTGCDMPWTVAFYALGGPRARDMGGIRSTAEQQMHRGSHQLRADDR